MLQKCYNLKDGTTFKCMFGVVIIKLFIQTCERGELMCVVSM